MSRVKSECNSFRSPMAYFRLVNGARVIVQMLVGAYRTIIAAMICLSAVQASGPSISVSSLHDQGVVLLTSSHPNFAAAWRHERAEGLDALVP